MSSRRMLLAVLLAGGIACGPGPNGKSGNDGFRNEANLLPFDEWITDENGVDYSKGDSTDWKRVEVPRNGTLFVRIACDNKSARIDAALFNKYGKLLIKKTKKSGFTDHIRFEGEVDRGRYFIRIKASTSRDKSVYSILASMEGGAGIGNIPRPE